MEDKEIKIIIVFLSFFLAVFYGALAVSLELFPYKYMIKPIIAAGSLKEALAIDEYNDQIRWVSPRPEEVGLVTAKQGRYQERALLYTSTQGTVAHLIDDSGRELHRWEISFNEVWPDQGHIVSLFHIDDSYAYFRDVHLFENGDLLAAVTIGGITPWGVGLVKLDKDSNVLWTYSGYVNNDFHVAPDGTIYVIEHAIREDKPENVESIFLPFLEDNIVQLDQDGREIKRISLIDAIDNSDFKALLKRIVNDGVGDITHSNSIEYIGRDNPDVPWLKEGYLAISVRNLNAMAILDPVKGDIVHVMALRTLMQHDIDYLANGNFMLFDNRGDIGGEGYTRIIEFNPLTQDIVWSYDGRSSSQEIESVFWGEQQRFDNGNTMIINAEEGEMREVTRDGEIVWRYFIPAYKDIDGVKNIATITHAEKIPAPYLKFNFSNRL